MALKASALKHIEPLHCLCFITMCIACNFKSRQKIDVQVLAYVLCFRKPWVHFGVLSQLHGTLVPPVVQQAMCVMRSSNVWVPVLLLLSCSRLHSVTKYVDAGHWRLEGQGQCGHSNGMNEVRATFRSLPPPLLSAKSAQYQELWIQVVVEVWAQCLQAGQISHQTGGLKQLL